PLTCILRLPAPPSSTLFPYTTLFRSNRVADAAAARMQHHPHAARLVEANLDEVVAAAERAELVSPPGVLPHPLLYAGVLLQNSLDRKSTRLNSSHVSISYAVFCLKKK